MKMMLILLVLVFAVACASTPSETAVEEQATEAATTEATDAAEKTAAEATPEQKEVVAKATETVKGFVEQKITCTANKENRILDSKLDGTGCEVVYTKNETPATVATAKYDLTHCTKAYDKIKANLINEGFKCE